MVKPNPKNTPPQYKPCFKVEKEKRIKLRKVKKDKGHSEFSAAITEDTTV